MAIVSNCLLIITHLGDSLWLFSKEIIFFVTQRAISIRLLINDTTGNASGLASIYPGLIGVLPEVLFGSD